MGNTRITGDARYINKPAEVVFDLFSDFTKFADRLPEDKKDKVVITKDTILTEAQGMQMGVQVTRREEPTLIVMEQFGNVPFTFSLNLRIWPLEEGCELQLQLDAELNMMIKMMLGGKLKDFVDQFTTQLAEGLNR
ncbi:MAG: SRPBCC family protein [Bacteroidales bacterium]|jgi:carbon monoxide dehydrogenase subunit G|nr:SRPBCC family protein [Bacteroidales bacterium]MDD2263948.1 SRPBCC family protein [Bacteroidales bacterium]MDD2831182.1 SRPBCC family protein [Bacteroidales bacterium]MDD3209293.1 SRPBCC family protein [Bacteroidales bacterium]MDD3697580.1 SRPBCC family protein [Bacteroidales bacterium]